MSSNKYDFFLSLSKKTGLDILSSTFADYLDDIDELHTFRNKFCFPQTESKTDTVYMNGNSLGLMPKDIKQAIDDQLKKWETRGSLGHIEEPMPWIGCDEEMLLEMADVVGSKVNEVAIMSQLTVNLHLMLVAFYKPKGDRFKILCEDGAFPSDFYVFESQTQYHGYNPKDAILKISPRKNENKIRTEDIISLIEKQGKQIALICLSGVQFLSGQFFKIKEITEVGHNFGCTVGWDLAHAVGNVPLMLHDWNVDFAVWCSYKYLNCGAGGIGGIFVHEKIEDDPSDAYFRGWWGHRSSDRFKMTNEFQCEKGALKYRLSNPSFICCAILKTSLKIFKEAGILNLRKKSILLTNYFEYLLLNKLTKKIFEIITPEEVDERGSQLSLNIFENIADIDKFLHEGGVMCDCRDPSILRMAPCALYNSFRDVYKVVDRLQDFINLLKID